MKALLAATALLATVLTQTGVARAQAPQPGPRLALVIGDGAYPRGPLATAANDAGLVAQTLTAAGFDVTGARDLDAEAVRRAFREFLEKDAAAGPDAIAFVYLSGYALQFDGDNYYVPVDATLARETDIPLQAIRLSDFTHALGALPMRARVVVVDGAYRNPGVPPSDHVAQGLALVDPDPGSLIAFNAAPGTVGTPSTSTYGVYGQALAEMLRDGGVSVEDVFDRVRLRVNETTRGAVVPWDASKLTASFMFLERGPDAPAVNSAQQSFSAMRRRPIREFPVEEAYSIAVARDDFQDYGEFIAAYPDSPFVGRVRRLLAVRREALIWRRTVGRNSPAAYWTYLRRYPKGPHLYDARRRLAILSAALQPPPSFAVIDYDVPPPPEGEYDIVDEPTVQLFDPDDPPPPPPPILFLPPRPTYFVDLPPPPPPVGPRFLPIPVPVPIPYSRPIVAPGQIVPPQGFTGGYAQPRPFATAPSGGLVPQPVQQNQPAQRVQPPSTQGNPQASMPNGAIRPSLPATQPGQVPAVVPGSLPSGGARPQPQALPNAARQAVPATQGSPRQTQPGQAAPGQPAPSQPGLRPGGQPPSASSTGIQARPGGAGTHLLPTQPLPGQTQGARPGTALPGAAPGQNLVRPAVPAAPGLPNQRRAPSQAIRPGTPLPGTVAPAVAHPAPAPAAQIHPAQQNQVLPRQNQQRLEQQQRAQQQIQQQQGQQRLQEQQRGQQRRSQEQQRLQEEQRAQQQRSQQQQQQNQQRLQEQQRAQQRRAEPPREQQQRPSRQDCGHLGQPPCR